MDHKSASKFPHIETHLFNLPSVWGYHAGFRVVWCSGANPSKDASSCAQAKRTSERNTSLTASPLITTRAYASFEEVKAEHIPSHNLPSNHLRSDIWQFEKHPKLLLYTNQFLIVCVHQSKSNSQLLTTRAKSCVSILLNAGHHECTLQP